MRRNELVFTYWLLFVLICMACQTAAAASPNTLNFLPAGQVQAQARLTSGRDQGTGRATDESRKQRDPDVAPYEAAKRARHRYGGRVLNVRLEHGPSGPYYRVTLLDSGRVRVVHIDAAN